MTLLWEAVRQYKGPGVAGLGVILGNMDPQLCRHGRMTWHLLSIKDRACVPSCHSVA